MSLLGLEIPKNERIPDGAYGIFQCPAMGISLPLYKSKGNDQAIVDAENSALIRPWGNGQLIADHANSKHNGKAWNVYDAKVGGKAFLLTNGKTKAYICTAIYRGQYHTYGYTYEGKLVKPHTGDLIAVSCGEKDVVYIGYFKYYGDMP